MRYKHMTADQRFATFVKKIEGGCWVWTGKLHRLGYARTKMGGGKSVYLHVWTYNKFVGPVPDGLELDHLCRNRACCNPAHLEPVTHQVNCRRGNVGLIQRTKTHCPHGHIYNDTNTYKWHGHRVCRTCIKEKIDARDAALKRGTFVPSKGVVTDRRCNECGATFKGTARAMFCSRRCRGVSGNRTRTARRRADKLNRP